MSYKKQLTVILSLFLIKTKNRKSAVCIFDVDYISFNAFCTVNSVRSDQINLEEFIGLNFNDLFDLFKSLV